MEPSSTDKKFDTIFQYADTHSSNLNTRFEAYGCNTLEAKVPVVSDRVVEQLKTVDEEDRIMATLALKTKSASSALEGRAPRTRNKDLTIVSVGNATILATGKERERSPVDPRQLDEEIEEYMRIAAEKKRRLADPNDSSPTTRPESATLATRPNTSRPTVGSIFKPLGHTQQPPTIRPQKEEKMDFNETPESQDDLDKDLEEYMARAKSLKAQKQRIAQSTDRAAMMEEMENYDM